MLAQNAIERAFELARSGRFNRIEQIRTVLVHEDYDHVDVHLAGAVIRRQLLSLCAAAEPNPTGAVTSPGAFACR